MTAPPSITDGLAERSDGSSSAGRRPRRRRVRRRPARKTARASLPTARGAAAGRLVEPGRRPRPARGRLRPAHERPLRRPRRCQRARQRPGTARGRLRSAQRRHQPGSQGASSLNDGLGQLYDGASEPRRRRCGGLCRGQSARWRASTPKSGDARDPGGRCGQQVSDGLSGSSLAAWATSRPVPAPRVTAPMA